MCKLGVSEKQEEGLGCSPAATVPACRERQGTLGFDTQYHRKPEAETKDCSKLSLATQGVCVQSGLCVTFVGGVGGRVERLRGITLVQFLLT